MLLEVRRRVYYLHWLLTWKDPDHNERVRYNSGFREIPTNGF
jgi:hypothetical protein